MATPTKIKDTYKVVKVYGPVTSVLSGNNMRIVQNWGYDQNIAPEHFNEIGNSKIVSTDYGAITTDVTIDCNISNKSVDNLLEVCNQAAGGSVTQDDFDDALCDILVPTTEDGTNITRSLVLPYQFLTGYDMNFTVDGVATESYRLSGGMDEEFLNDYRNVMVEVSATAVLNGSDTDITVTSTASAGVFTPLYVYADGVKYSRFESEVGFSDGTTVTVSGVDVSDNSRFTVVFGKASGTFSEISSADADVGGLRGDKVVAWIADGSVPTSSDKWLRVQGVSVSVPLDREELRELGTVDPIDRSLNYPLEMTATVDILENDLERYCSAAGKTFATQDYLNPRMFQSNDDLNLTVVVYDDDPALDTANVIMTVSGQNLRVNGRGTSLAVGGNATARWDFIFDTIDISKTGN